MDDHYRGEERSSVRSALDHDHADPLDPGLLSFGDDEGLAGLPPLTSWDLSQDSHRREFLFHYYWIGEPALFAAVSHVWTSLNQPQAHCTLIGLLSGTGGTGKLGLLLTLQDFLARALASITPIPPRADYDSLEAWHRASMATYDCDEARVTALCARYAAILDGRSPDVAAQGSATILQGPWR